VIDAPLALAFGAGMVATVNPCGFAMLPAYLAFFLGAEGAERDGRASVRRSLQVGLSVSAGFLTVFSAVGLAIYHLSASVDRWTPWATIVIGAVLVVLGIAVVRGYEPVLALPKLEKGGKRRSGSSMFLFGISYAVASISCSLPLFTSAVAGTFRRENLVSSLAVFVAYAVGMILVLLALTVSLGMARQGLVRWLRKALPYVTRTSGVLLVVAGAYLVHYGWYERRVRGNAGAESSRPVEVVTGWSEDIGRWVTDVGPTRLGLLLALALLAVLTATFGLRARDR
jgi:cytochrome c biogenesis protein CcdA